MARPGRCPGLFDGAWAEGLAAAISAPREQTFGSVSLQQIDLSQASLKISLRP